MGRAQLAQLPAHIDRLRPTAIGRQQHLRQVFPQGRRDQNATAALRLQPFVAIMRRHRRIEGAQVPVDIEHDFDGAGEFPFQACCDLRAIRQLHTDAVFRSADLQPQDGARRALIDVA